MAAACDERERAIVSLLLMAGLRRSELVGLDREDVSEDCAELRIDGKGGAERLVPLPTDAQVALARHIEKAGITEGSVFRGRTGKRLQQTSLQRIWKRIVERAQLQDHGFRIHSCRGFYCTSLLRSGADLDDDGKLEVIASFFDPYSGTRTLSHEGEGAIRGHKGRLLCVPPVPPSFCLFLLVVQGIVGMGHGCRRKGARGEAAFAPASPDFRRRAPQEPRRAVRGSLTPPRAGRSKGGDIGLCLTYNAPSFSVDSAGRSAEVVRLRIIALGAVAVGGLEGGSGVDGSAGDGAAEAAEVGGDAGKEHGAGEGGVGDADEDGDLGVLVVAVVEEGAGVVGGVTGDGEGAHDG
jgi:hypothetical protein